MTSLLEYANAYHSFGKQDPKARVYFESRGLSERTVDHFMFGWVSQPINGFDKNYVKTAVIPYLTARGGVLELRVRRPGNVKPKYLSMAESFPLNGSPKAHLYNAQQAMPSPRTNHVYLTEGEFDAAILWQCGLRAVGVPGCQQWYEPWTYLFQNAFVHIVYDGDDAGHAGASKVGICMAKYNIPYDVVELPEGQDVTDLYLTGGRELILDTLNH